MSELIITVGPPGSGKSTWADANLPAHTLRLERDRMREAFWGSREAYHQDPFENKSYLIGSAMYRAGMLWPQDQSIALTDTNVMWSLVKRFWPLRLSHRVILFDIPDEILMQRNHTRPAAHRLPAEILRQYLRDFRNPANHWWTHPSIEVETITS